MFDKVTPESVFRTLIGQLVAILVGLGVYHISQSIVAALVVAVVTGRIMKIVGL